VSGVNPADRVAYSSPAKTAVTSYVPAVGNVTGQSAVLTGLPSPVSATLAHAAVKPPGPVIVKVIVSWFEGPYCASL
jgi:hypothetical protein